MNSVKANSHHPSSLLNRWFSVLMVAAGLFRLCFAHFCVYKLRTDVLLQYTRLLIKQTPILWRNLQLNGLRVKSAMRKSTMHNHLFNGMESRNADCFSFSHVTFLAAAFRTVGRTIHLTIEKKTIQYQKERKVLDLRKSKDVKFIKKPSQHKVIITPCFW